MTRPPGAALDDTAGDSLLGRYRRAAIGILILVALGPPAIRILSDHSVPPGQRWFLLSGTIAFVLISGVFGLAPRAPVLRSPPWAALTLIVALGVTLFVAGGINWLAVLAVAAGACGRFASVRWPAVASSVACAGAGCYVAVTDHVGIGSTFAAIVIGPMAAFFAYAASRRADTVSALRRTRADLARAAVAEERLRIARDLHDLLGHSLSLITLKAELAGRVVGTDPDRAAREIAELETVARQSLTDVRAAVAGYRQPDLAGELAAARQLLDSAGIASRITSPDAPCLPQDVDAALAWAVREGTTNVVRHSRATRVSISVSASPAAAVAEISDNGPPAADGLAWPPVGRPQPAQPAASSLLPLSSAAASATVIGSDGTVRLNRARSGGSGLTGLAERVRALGGELAAGAVEPDGFRLRVVVPLGAQA